jgi:hypothetical protein
MGLDFDALLTGPVVDVFSCSVLHARATGDFTPARGVFDRAHVEVGFTDSGAPITGVRTYLGVRLSDFTSGAPTQGDRFKVALIGSVQVDIDPLPSGAAIEQFSVAEVQKDGVGGATLVLTGRVSV